MKNQEYKLSDIDTYDDSYTAINGIDIKRIVSEATIEYADNYDENSYYNEEDYYNDNLDAIDKLIEKETIEYLNNEYPIEKYSYSYKTEWECDYDYKNEYKIKLSLCIKELDTKYEDKDSVITVTDYFNQDNRYSITLTKGKPTEEFINYILDIHGYSPKEYSYYIKNGFIEPLWKDN